MAGVRVVSEPTLKLRELDTQELFYEQHIKPRTEEGKRAIKIAMCYFAIALGCLLSGIALLYFAWRQFSG